MSCERIRMMGSTNDLNHIGMEFWAEHSSKHPDPKYPQERCRSLLERFVAKLRSKA